MKINHQPAPNRPQYTDDLKDFISKDNFNKFCGLIEECKEFWFDFDGVFGPTELVQIISITDVLNKGTGRHYDFRDIEKVVSGMPLPKIFQLFHDEYGLPGTPEENLKKQRQAYMDIVHDYDLKAFPFMKPILDYAKALKKEVNVISNGLPEDLLKEWGLRDLVADVFPSTDPRRQGFKGKGDFILSHLLKKGLSPDEVGIVEDNPKTHESIQKDIVNYQREQGFFKTAIKKLRQIFILQEFNKDYGFEPNTGIKINGFCPELYNDRIRQAADYKYGTRYGSRPDRVRYMPALG